MPQELPDHIQTLDAESIPALDNGAFGDAINKAFRTIFSDILDRPSNAQGKPEKRKLKIEIDFIPEVEEQDKRALTGIKIEPKVQGDIPAIVGGLTDVRFVGKTPCFNKDCPTNFYQKPLSLDFDEQPAA